MILSGEMGDTREQVAPADSESSVVPSTCWDAAPFDGSLLTVRTERYSRSDPTIFIRLRRAVLR